LNKQTAKSFTDTQKLVVLIVVMKLLCFLQSMFSEIDIFDNKGYQSW